MLLYFFLLMGLIVSACCGCAPELTKPDGSCAACVPGVEWGAAMSACGPDEFCTDAGECASVLTHPLLGQECPFETVPDMERGSSLFCGTLRCVRKACVACAEGEARPNGLRCTKGAWRYPVEPKGDAATLLLLVNAALMILAAGGLLLRALFARTCKGGEGREKPVV